MSRMESYNQSKSEVFKNGFTTIQNVFTEDQVEQIIKVIDATDGSRDTFRRVRLGGKTKT